MYTYLSISSTRQLWIFWTYFWVVFVVRRSLPSRPPNTVIGPAARAPRSGKKKTRHRAFPFPASSTSATAADGDPLRKLRPSPVPSYLILCRRPRTRQPQRRHRRRLRPLVLHLLLETISTTPAGHGRWLIASDRSGIGFISPFPGKDALPWLLWQIDCCFSVAWIETVNALPIFHLDLVSRIWARRKPNMPHFLWDCCDRYSGESTGCFHLRIELWLAVVWWSSNIRSRMGPMNCSQWG